MLPRSCRQARTSGRRCTDLDRGAVPLMRFGTMTRFGPSAGAEPFGVAPHRFLATKGATMKTMTIVTTAALFSLVCATTLAATGPSPSALYDRAKRAIAAGNVVPERDLAPLVDVLRGPSS